MSCDTATAGTWVSRRNVVAEHHFSQHGHQSCPSVNRPLETFKEQQLLCQPECFGDGNCPPAAAHAKEYHIFGSSFSPSAFLEFMANRTFSFVGDSLVRQQFLMLACQVLTIPAVLFVGHCSTHSQQAPVAGWLFLSLTKRPHRTDTSASVSHHAHMAHRPHHMIS